MSKLKETKTDNYFDTILMEYKGMDEYIKKIHLRQLTFLYYTILILFTALFFILDVENVEYKPYYPYVLVVIGALFLYDYSVLQTYIGYRTYLANQINQSIGKKAILTPSIANKFILDGKKNFSNYLIIAIWFIIITSFMIYSHYGHFLNAHFFIQIAIFSIFSYSFYLSSLRRFEVKEYLLNNKS